MDGEGPRVRALAASRSPVRGNPRRAPERGIRHSLQTPKVRSRSCTKPRPGRAGRSGRRSRTHCGPRLERAEGEVGSLMRAVQSEVRPDVLDSEPQRRALPRRASVYGALVGVAAILAATPLLLRLDEPSTSQWIIFGILAAGAAASHTYTVRTARDTAFHTSWVFLIPSALLLPPELVALLGVVMHVPEWLKERYAWYIQTFNICNYTLGNLATWGAAALLLRADGLIANDNLRWSLAGLAACIVAVGANHVILAPMVTLARGHSLREAGVFSFESLSTDFILATLGLAVAAFWDLNPWLIPFAVAPLLLIHRSLAIPQLQAEARVDPKTGLYNARHFASVMQEELGRAQRFQRPMALIMADLDLLRDINNTYGHLAGDAVLRGISEVFRQQLRHYDVPARFGGEELSILLPETPPDEAYEIADRIRRAVAARRYEVETSSEPIRATISMGVAGYPRDGADMNELVHQADLAVYRAKLQGRNRVLDASDEPLLTQPQQRAPRLTVLPGGDDEPIRPLPAAPEIVPDVERRQAVRPHNVPAPRFFSVPGRVAILVGLVGLVGTTAGIVTAFYGGSRDVVGLVTIVVLVGLGQVLSLEVEETGSISVSAVGALAAAAIIGPRAALALALTMSAVEWSARRASFHQLLFNIGALSLASLAAAAVFSAHLPGSIGTAIFVAS